MALCPNCGRENLDGATQCGTCGYPLSGSTSSSDAEPSAGSSGYTLPPGYLPTPEAQPPPEFDLPAGHPEYQEQAGYQSPPASNRSQSSAPVSFPKRPAPGQRTRQFFAGLGLGLIPSAIGVILTGIGLNRITNTTGSGYARLSSAEFGLCMEGTFFIFFLAGAIALMSNTDRRFWGYGMLAGVLISPVVFFISCGVLLANYR